MEKQVARLNIEHFHHLLARETDETRRSTILKLLAEEEAKLAELLKASETGSTPSA